jgi:hypothetical protein
MCPVSSRAALRPPHDCTPTAQARGSPRSPTPSACSLTCPCFASGRPLAATLTWRGSLLGEVKGARHPASQPHRGQLAPRRRDIARAPHHTCRHEARRFNSPSRRCCTCSGRRRGSATRPLQQQRRRRRVVYRGHHQTATARTRTTVPVVTPPRLPRCGPRHRRPPWVAQRAPPPLHAMSTRGRSLRRWTVWHGTAPALRRPRGRCRRRCV